MTLLYLHVMMFIDHDLPVCFRLALFQLLEELASRNLKQQSDQCGQRVLLRGLQFGLRSSYTSVCPLIYLAG